MIGNGRGLLTGALTLCLACGDAPPADQAKAAAPGVALVEQAFQTARDTVDNIDSPAVWHGPNGEHWLLSTAKETDVVVVTDAATGSFLRRVGGTGKAAGQMDRPNGIAIIDDLMFVVERDNARVQVFTLPEFEPIGTYGTTELRKPYGIAIEQTAPGKYDTWITDNYEFQEDVVPPDSLLGQRVRRYHVSVQPGSARAALTHTFGDTHGPGVLRVVESIAVDPAHDLLLIAEEQEGASMIKGYTRDGRFTGRIVPARYFPNQAEGIVLYACGDSAGYWVTTDQGMETNTFHVFDRITLEHRASFQTAGVLNTDGIALTQTAFASFPAGAFYAVHNDGSVAGVSWRAVASATNLRADCVATVPARTSP